jgi:hypothetical protein
MIRQKLFENFAHPRGLWGRLAGEVMARKPANRERGRWALAELDPAPDDRLLGHDGDRPAALTGPALLPGGQRVSASRAARASR